MATKQQWNDFYKSDPQMQEWTVKAIKDTRYRGKVYKKWVQYCKKNNIDEKFDFFNYDNGQIEKK